MSTDSLNESAPSDFNTSQRVFSHGPDETGAVPATAEHVALDLRNLIRVR